MSCDNTYVVRQLVTLSSGYHKRWLRLLRGCNACKINGRVRCVIQPGIVPCSDDDGQQCHPVQYPSIRPSTDYFYTPPSATVVNV